MDDNEVFDNDSDSDNENDQILANLIKSSLSNQALTQALTAFVMNGEKDKEEKKGKQSTHFTKPRNPPDWTKNMKYEILRWSEKWKSSQKSLAPWFSWSFTKLR